MTAFFVRKNRERRERREKDRPPGEVDADAIRYQRMLAER
jgi:hypothetical protein